MPDGCTLTGLAQAFAGAVYAVGVCHGTATLLSLGGSQPAGADTIGTSTPLLGVLPKATPPRAGH